jgi:hypothetical protein
LFFSVANDGIKKFYWLIAFGVFLGLCVPLLLGKVYACIDARTTLYSHTNTPLLIVSFSIRKIPRDTNLIADELSLRIDVSMYKRQTSVHPFFVAEID